MRGSITSCFVPPPRLAEENLRYGLGHPSLETAPSKQFSFSNIEEVR